MPLRLLILLTLTAFAAPGQQVHANDSQPICGKPPCTLVHIDAVSYYDSQVQRDLGPRASMINDIMVSNDQGTYILTCSPKDRTCIAPTVGADYEFVDKGGKWTFLKDLVGGYAERKTIFLRGAGGFLGAYWLEAHVPITPGSEVQRLIAACNAKQDFPDEVRCARWLNRREEARRDACPDSDAALACHSFQELIAAGDFMGDFAQKDHVLTCFREKEDVFFNLWFVEPDQTRWQQENHKPNS